MHKLLSGANAEKWAKKWTEEWVVKLAAVVRRSFPKLAFAFLVAGVVWVGGMPGWAEAKTQAFTDLANRAATVAVGELPKQGTETYNQIRQGGPFAYEKDGVVFGNRERQLPIEKRGYYREYTVKTPGAKNRGARRIVCGGQPKTPDACYYTDDHYASFRKIVP